MLILPGLGLLAVLPVHSLTDKQIGILRILGNHRYGPCVCAVGHLDPPPFRPQNHLRRENPPLVLYGLPLLKTAPEFLRNLLGSGPLHVKFSLSRYGNRIAIADDIVLDAVGVDHVGPDRKLLSRL